MLDDGMTTQIPLTLAGSESTHQAFINRNLLFHFKNAGRSYTHLAACENGGRLSSEMQRIDMRSEPAQPKFTASRREFLPGDRRWLNLRSRVESNDVSAWQTQRVR